MASFPAQKEHASNSRQVGTVIDGPFTEAKELIAGFQIWQVKSLEEAVEWVKRAPSSHTGESEVKSARSLRWKTSHPPVRRADPAQNQRSELSSKSDRQH